MHIGSNHVQFCLRTKTKESKRVFVKWLHSRTKNIKRNKMTHLWVSHISHIFVHTPETATIVFKKQMFMTQNHSNSLFNPVVAYCSPDLIACLHFRVWTHRCLLNSHSLFFSESLISRVFLTANLLCFSWQAFKSALNGKQIRRNMGVTVIVRLPLQMPFKYSGHVKWFSIVSNVSQRLHVQQRHRSGQSAR